MDAKQIDFYARANCRGVGHEEFFGPNEDKPRETTEEKKRREARARRLCQGCPVEADCLTYSGSFKSHMSGIWGGLDAEERHARRRNEARRARKQQKQAS